MGVYPGPLSIRPILSLCYMRVFGPLLPSVLPNVTTDPESLHSYPSLDMPVPGHPASVPYSPAESASQISMSEAGPWEPGSGGGKDILGR